MIEDTSNVEGVFLSAREIAPPLTAEHDSKVQFVMVRESYSMSESLHTAAPFD